MRGRKYVWLALVLASVACAAHEVRLMPQCCADDRALFTDDFEDGAPLDAYFTGIFGSVALTPGSGINGSTGVVSTDLGELSVTFPTNYDICGNFRTSFAIGRYWNPSADETLFYIIELRSTVLPAETIVSIQRDGADIVVYTGSSSDEIYRIFNVVTEGTYIKVEARGTINTVDASGLSMNDGSIELRINNRVYQDGDDFSAINPDDPLPECPKGVTGVTFRTDYPDGDTGSWDKVTFAPMGALDCVYITEDGSYCNDGPKKPGAKCDPPGPGGSSFDGSAQGPRIVHPGGFIATYTPPAGGGVLPTASDPVDAQSLVDASTVLVSLDLTLTNGSVVSYGQAPIVASGRAYAQPLVTRFGPVEYPLSDDQGNWKSQLWTVDIADPSGTLRGYLDSTTNRFWKRWEGHLYTETNVARLAGTARRSAARGRCISVTTPDDLVVRLTFADELTRQDNTGELDRVLPRFTIGEIFHGPATTADGIQFLAMSVPVQKPVNPDAVHAASTPPEFTDSVPQPPENMRTQAMPAIWGIASDDFRSADNPPVTPVGICKAYLIGDVLLKGSEVWQCYLASQYAMKEISALFGSNMNTDCPGSVRLDLDALTDQFLVPGHGNWSSYFATNYTDVTWGPQEYRTMLFFGRGPISQQHVAGTVPLSFNGLGIETVGDCSGDLIDDLAYIAQHFLDHPVFQHTLVGNWNAVATYADGTAKINTSSVTAVKTIHDARLSTRYRGRFIMDTKKSWKEHFADLLVSGNMRAGYNEHGQVFLTTMDDTQALTGLTAYTDLAHIKDGSFVVSSERSGGLQNRLTYDWGIEPATGRTSGQPATADDTPSQTNWAEVAAAPDLHYQAIGAQAVADDVSGRRLLRTKDGITSGELTIDLAGTELVSGDLIRVTDFRGLGSSGWTDRVLLVDGRVLNPNVSDPPQAEDLTLLIQWEDQQRALVAPAGLIGGGVTSDGSTTSGVGFNPVGTTAGANGWTVGDDATGNGWRVG